MNPPRPAGIVNRQHIFEREGNGGHVNIGYVDGHSDTMKVYIYILYPPDGSIVDIFIKTVVSVWKKIPWKITHASTK